MKNFLTIISLSTVALVSSFAGYSQVQATIKQTGVNQITLYARSTTSYNTQVGNFTFAVSIPDQGAGNPTDAEITKTLVPNNVYFETSGLTNPYIIGDRAWYTYNILPVTGSDVNTSWPANTDNPVVIMTFPTDSYFDSMRLDDIKNDPANITNTLYLYVQLNAGLGDVTDNTTPYYGTGAVNNGGSANQFVPLEITPVPVKFVGFSAIKKDNSALLTWQITNEDANVASYEVERSINGIAFNKITTIAPKNNGSTTNVYNLTDDNLSSVQAGIIYYRIKQIDKDGKSIFTDIKSVRVSNNGIAIGVYPNPVKSTANLSLDLIEDATVIINLTDAAGKEIKHLNVKAKKGLNVQRIDMNSLASGNYLLKVQAGSDVKTLPVVKSN